jgi:hypothetical protein
MLRVEPDPRASLLLAHKQPTQNRVETTVFLDVLQHIVLTIRLPGEEVVEESAELDVFGGLGQLIRGERVGSNSLTVPSQNNLDAGKGLEMLSRVTPILWLFI